MADWSDYQNRKSVHFSEPRNHCLAPGGSEYGRYLWVRQHIGFAMRVLDIGCNCGQLAENLTNDLGCEVWGIDVIPQFIQYCRANKTPFGRFLCRDFGAMTPQDVRLLGAFDVVTALEVIEHDIDVRGFRDNVWRVLRPGGLLIVTTPHPGGFLASREDHPCHVRLWTPWRLEMVFGPAQAMADIERDECGRLLSLGAVFVKEA